MLAAFIVLTLLDANFANTFAVAVRDLASSFDPGLPDLFLPTDPRSPWCSAFGVAAILWYVITSVVCAPCGTSAERRVRFMNRMAARR